MNYKNENVYTIYNMYTQCFTLNVTNFVHSIYCIASQAGTLLINFA